MFEGCSRKDACERKEGATVSVRPSDLPGRRDRGFGANINGDVWVLGFGASSQKGMDPERIRVYTFEANFVYV